LLSAVEYLLQRDVWIALAEHVLLPFVSVLLHINLSSVNDVQSLLQGIEALTLKIVDRLRFFNA
jgi:hypothetical protein